MDFRILGPLEVVDAGRTVRLGEGRQRALLALLLLRPNQVVSSDRLVEELWDEEPAPTAPKMLQKYVWQLRTTLDDRESTPGSRRIETRGQGYLLRIQPDELDASRFERLLAEGRRARAEGRPDAAETLRDAIALWRGPALEEFADRAFARSEVARLEEMRLAALEERIGADLDLGRHADVIAELETLVAEQPLRERLRGQLMLALYRSDRQAQALRVYRDTHRMFGDELGLDPSPELQRLQRAILAQDPSLDWTAPSAPGADEAAAPGEAPYRGLEYFDVDDAPWFFGRERLTARLVERIRTTRLLAVVGASGSGKSSLVRAGLVATRETRGRRTPPHLRHHAHRTPARGARAGPERRREPAAVDGRADRRPGRRATDPPPRSAPTGRGSGAARGNRDAARRGPVRGAVHAVPGRAGAERVRGEPHDGGRHGRPDRDRHHAPRRLLRPSRRLCGPAERRGERAGVHRPDDGRRAAPIDHRTRRARRLGARSRSRRRHHPRSRGRARSPAPAVACPARDVAPATGQDPDRRWLRGGGRRPQGDRAHGRPPVREGARRRRAGDRAAPPPPADRAGRRHRRYPTQGRPPGADPVLATRGRGGRHSGPQPIDGRTARDDRGADRRGGARGADPRVADPARLAVRGPRRPPDAPPDHRGRRPVGGDGPGSRGALPRHAARSGHGLGRLPSRNAERARAGVHRRVERAGRARGRGTRGAAPTRARGRRAVCRRRATPGGAGGGCGEPAPTARGRPERRARPRGRARGRRAGLRPAGPQQLRRRRQPAARGGGERHPPAR